MDPARKTYARFLVVFIAYFATAKVGQALFYNFHTSPAVLWPPVGIALGFLVVWGYEQWIPVALAQLFVAILSPSNPGWAAITASTVGYTFQAIGGAYALKKLHFEGLIPRTRAVLELLAVAFVAPAIAPAIITLTAFSTHTLTVSGWINWSRSWAGGVFSVLILTPLITTWLSDATPKLKELKINESILALGAVLATTYILFWTSLPVANSFVLIYFFLGAFFWIGLRLQPRVMTAGLFLAAVFGIAGSIIAHPTPTPLSVQLFADELFLVLITPIFLIMNVTVTERRIAVANYEKEARELAEAMKKLSSQDTSKNEFIAMLAHELRNPLAPIASTLEYLRLNEQNLEHLQAVEVAEQQIRIVRRLLDDLLDVARITQKKFKLQKEMVALDAVIQPAIAAINPFFRSKGHSFSVSLPSEKISIEVDAVRLTQGITNLLLNAAKYTPPGGLIELKAEHEDDMLAIRVRDNGMGISAEMLPLIFEPFQQTPREPHAGTGLGLGLFITKQLIEMHGGTLTAASDGLNQGSTLLIRVPLPVKTQPAPVTVTNASLFSSGLSPVVRKFNILVVDDNESAARALQKLLAFRGHSVSTVYDGKTALQAVAAFEPQVVILDIGLPDMNGYAIAREIRKTGATTALIALTGYGQEQDRLEAQKAGFDHHLTKPISLADIEKVFGVLVV